MKSEKKRASKSKGMGKNHNDDESTPKRRKKCDMSITEVRYVIDDEGFDYCFMHSSKFEEVKDKTFHELRLAYIEATTNLGNYIKIKCNEEDVK